MVLLFYCDIVTFIDFSSLLFFRESNLKMLKVQIWRLPPVSEDSFACCVLCPEADARSLSAPLLGDSSCTLLVDF